MSEEAVDVDVWLLEPPPEQGLPSFTKTGTATLLGELEDCNKENMSEIIYKIHHSKYKYVSYKLFQHRIVVSINDSYRSLPVPNILIFGIEIDKTEAKVLISVLCAEQKCD